MVPQDDLSFNINEQEFKIFFGVYLMECELFKFPSQIFLSVMPKSFTKTFVTKWILQSPLNTL